MSTSHREKKTNIMFDISTGRSEREGDREMGRSNDDDDEKAHAKINIECWNSH